MIKFRIKKIFFADALTETHIPNMNIFESFFVRILFSKGKKKDYYFSIY